MDYATAKSITAAYKPDLVIDDPNAEIPKALVVRRKKDSMPFSIHVPTHLPNPDVSADDQAKAEEATLKHSLDMAEKTLPPLATA